MPCGWLNIIKCVVKNVSRITSLAWIFSFTWNNNSNIQPKSVDPGLQRSTFGPDRRRPSRTKTMVYGVIRSVQAALKYRGGWRGLLEHMYTVSGDRLNWHDGRAGHLSELIIIHSPNLSFLLAEWRLPLQIRNVHGPRCRGKSLLRKSRRLSLRPTSLGEF